MILDIRYQDKHPEQIQHVRMITIYPHAAANANPEAIIHSVQYTTSPRFITLSEVITITVTND